MSGENRRFGGFLLPVLVVAVGAYFLFTGARSGTLRAASLKPVTWAALRLMLVGLVAALRRSPALKLVGTLVCGVGAILVICL